MRRTSVRSLPFPMQVVLVASAVFGLTLYAVTPSAPGRVAIDALVKSRTTDQHFSGCNAARAAGRQDIPSWDPSYRRWMDGDGDGLACEPRRGRY